MKWPKSAWDQACIAGVGALVTAILGARWLYTSRLAQYVSEYPRDGQDGLGAFVDAVEWFPVLLLAAFAFLFIAQRILTQEIPAESADPSAAPQDDKHQVE